MLNLEMEKKRLADLQEKASKMKTHSAEKWKLNEQIKLQQKIVNRAEKEKADIPKGKLTSAKIALGAILFNQLTENDLYIMLNNQNYKGVKLQYSVLCTLTDYYNSKFNKTKDYPIKPVKQEKATETPQPQATETKTETPKTPEKHSWFH